MLRSNKFHLRAALPALFFSLLIFGVSRPVLAETAADNLVIEDGVTANGLNLSGMTVAEAADALNAYFEAVADSQLTVSFGKQTASLELSSLSLSWDADSAAKKAATFGKAGPLVARYKEQKDLQASSVAVDAAYTYDKTAVEKFVTEEIAAKDGEPQDAQITREDGEFVITPEVDGQTTNVEETVAAITETLDSSLSDHMTAEAVVELTEAQVTEEDLSTIEDCLGTFSTSYSTSASGRKNNIKVGSGNINGTVLMPGESFSASDTMKPRTRANGYQSAPQYSNGQSEMAVGGGVCQVSTTLYNAVLRAELQIDERYPHSMLVSYVPCSSDAAIASGSKDFVFTNDQETPIYIEATADGSTLTFSIYGKETRPSNRTIEFLSTNLSSSKVINVDQSMADGQTRFSSGHPAVRSTLTKVVYVDGEEVSREVLHTDSYRSSSSSSDSKKSSSKDSSKKKESKTTEAETTKKSKETTAETTKKSKETTEETTKKSKETTEETTKKSKETTEETTKKSKETTEETTKKSKETTAESKKSSKKETTAESKKSSKEETTAESKKSSKKETTAESKKSSKKETTAESKKSSKKETTAESKKSSKKETTAESKKSSKKKSTKKSETKSSKKKSDKKTKKSSD